MSKNRYAYIDREGNQVEVVADTPEQALTQIAPSEISDAHSGVMYLGPATTMGDDTMPVDSDENQSPEFLAAMASGGAGGRGDTTGMTPSQIEARDKQMMEYLNAVPGYTALTRNPGESTADFKARIANRPFHLAGGGGHSASPEQIAFAKAQAFKSTQAGTISPYTSYAFNRDLISGSKRAYQNLRATLTDVTSDAWASPGTKEDKMKGSLEVTANEIAKLFTSEQDFRSAYTFNPEFKLTIDELTKAGVTQESIMGRITKPATYQDMPAEQSVAEYLGNNLSKDATPEQIEAYNALIPEKQLAQDQIAYLANIAKGKMDLYFGTPEKLGLIDEKIINAEEVKKTAEKKIQLAEQDAKAQSQYIIDKNNSDVDIELGKIEKNRLKAKNYMTGALAKLGALNTTGAAPLALATLEEKYESKASELRTKLTFANRKIEMDLNKEVNDLEIKKDEWINKIANDLTKDKETIMKEILKIEADTNKETYKINLSYAKNFRTLTDKYVALNKAEAEKFAKEFARIATNKAKANAPKEDNNVMEGQYSVANKGILLPDGTYESYYLPPSMAQEVADANIVGKDSIVFFKSTEAAFRDWFVKSNDKTDVYLDTLKASYDIWKAETKKGRKTTTTSEFDSL